jgi:DegV family protein with EDD domain
MGLGFLALEGARLARQGKDRRAILQRMQSVRQGIRLYFLVDTLEFLRRGGRIGGTQALVGSILQVKPILTITNGRIEVAEKVPGKKRAYARLLQTVGEARKKHPEAQIHLAVHEGGAPEAGRELQRRLEGLLQPVESYCSPLGCALGVHAGPGLVGCVYYLEEDGQVVPAEEVG